MRVEVAGQLGKSNVIRAYAGDDIAADPPDRPVVVAEKPRRDRCFTRRTVLGPRANQRDIPADILFQELVGVEQVVFVVLFEHREAQRFRERANVNCRRVHRGGDVHEAEIDGSARQIDLPDVAHQGDIGVVDGDGQIDLVVQRGLPPSRGFNRSGDRVWGGAV